MGMYTQVRGWLNINSIYIEDEDLIKNRLDEAKKDFREKHEHSNVATFIVDDTLIHSGSNDSVFLFFGTELKNYSEDCETWIEHLLLYFPSAEGRIDFQYELEEREENSESKFWEIYEGKIEESASKTWCKGYGNSFR